MGDTYNLTLGKSGDGSIEEVTIVGQLQQIQTAAGPSATFGNAALRQAVAFDRDIKDVFQFDPRLSIDSGGRGSPVNCAGKHPRFNSTTLDGVSHNDRFGLNDNGYSTATGLPFPFDGIEQVSVELAPFDVTYGGFSACNINAVTKAGSNEWIGSVFYEYTTDSFRGDSLTSVADRGGADIRIDGEGYTEDKKGFSFSGPLMRDKLFISVAYEESEQPEFIAQGFDGSGNGEQRDWLSEADFNRVQQIAQTVYGYDAGGQPGDGTQTDKKYMVRGDWNIVQDHNATIIYNYYDGAESRASDSDSDEFEFANHFYTKGAESETYTLILNSQWTDAWSTQLYYSTSELIDTQITVGDRDFAEIQIEIDDGNTIYLGADDSRQANALSYDSDFLKISTQYLAGDHIITAGYEREELNVFNQFVQHARGGEIRIFNEEDDGGLSAIDKFEQGIFDRYYYGSGGGTNDALDAAAMFSNVLNTLYVQDEFFLDDQNLTIVTGLRYDFFDSDDQPRFNQAFFDATGVRNDAGIDGLDIIMPRLGFTWEPADDLSIRGGIGLYSGGNPNVWISNAWSNDGITNAQFQCRPGRDDACDFAATDTLLTLSDNPGFAVPGQLIDAVAAVSDADGTTSRLALIDPNYEQPSEWKYALGLTKDFENGLTLDFDILYSQLKDAAMYVDLSQEVVGMTTTGQPIYDFVTGSDNYMLTNSSDDATASTVSLVLKKSFDYGLDITFGYATTSAEDISPMTSSTAGSNFDNVATLDVNNPIAGTSNYEVPHRFTFNASYSKEFFEDLTTRFTLSAQRYAGQGASYVMQSIGLEGDGFRGRHPLYVPTGLDDPNVVFDTGFDSNAFFAWAQGEGLSGGSFVARNSVSSRWTGRVDFRFDQELPTFIDGTSGQFFIKVYNLGNLINDSWGHHYDAEFFSQQVVGASVNDQGQYVFESFRARDPDDFQQEDSLWEIRLGLEFNF